MQIKRLQDTDRAVLWAVPEPEPFEPHPFIFAHSAPVQSRYTPGKILRHSAKHVWENGQRFYACGGTVLPGVTTILRNSEPASRAAILANWRRKMIREHGEEKAKELMAARPAIGSHVHKWIEDYLLQGTEPDPELPHVGFWDSVKPVLSRISGIRAIESAVINRTLGYAGTIDLCANWDGEVAVIDWKTSEKPKTSVDKLYDYPLQLAAYCGAINQDTELYGFTVTRAVIVVCYEGREATVFDFDLLDLEGYWDGWCDRFRTYKERRL